MQLSKPHLRFLRLEQCVGAGVVNVVINAVIVWLLMRSLTEVPLWGDVSMGGDLLATGFILPFATCLIVSGLTRGRVASGKLPALEAEQIALQGLHTRPVIVRGIVIGIVGVIFASAPMVTLLHLAGAQPVAFLTFLGFKAIWAGLFAMVVSPIIAWWALSAASSSFSSEATSA